MQPNPRELVISDWEDILYLQYNIYKISCSDEGGLCGNACDMLTLISVINTVSSRSQCMQMLNLCSPSTKGFEYASPVGTTRQIGQPNLLRSCSSIGHGHRFLLLNVPDYSQANWPRSNYSLARS